MAQPLALLISSGADRARALQTMLQQSGYLAIVTGCACTARLWLRRVAVDLVVADAQLPDARVETVLHALSTASRAVPVPTIVLGTLTPAESRTVAGAPEVMVRASETDLASIAVLADTARRVGPAARPRAARPAALRLPPRPAPVHPPLGGG